jgi:hypothetical protein
MKFPPAHLDLPVGFLRPLIFSLFQNVIRLLLLLVFWVSFFVDCTIAAMAVKFRICSKSKPLDSRVGLRLPTNISNGLILIEFLSFLLDLQWDCRFPKFPKICRPEVFWRWLPLLDKREHGSSQSVASVVERPLWNPNKVNE